MPSYVRAGIRKCAEIRALGAADIFLETERKDFRMSGLEERERAVGLYFATPMTTAQVVEHLSRGHRRGEIQLHRTSPFLGAEYVIILSFSLQENVRSLLSITFNAYAQ